MVLLLLVIVETIDELRLGPCSLREFDHGQAVKSAYYTKLCKITREKLTILKQGWLFAGKTLRGVYPERNILQSIHSFRMTT
jgi:hypothetical protein